MKVFKWLRNNFLIDTYVIANSKNTIYDNKLDRGNRIVNVTGPTTVRPKSNAMGSSVCVTGYNV